HAFGNRFCLLHRTDHQFSHAARGLWAIVMNTLCRLVCSARQGEGLFSSGAPALCPAWVSPHGAFTKCPEDGAVSISTAPERLSREAVLSHDVSAAGLAWRRNDFRLPFARNSVSSLIMRIAVVGSALILLCTSAFAAGEPASPPPAPQAGKGPCLADVD